MSNRHWMAIAVLTIAACTARPRSIRMTTSSAIPAAQGTVTASSSANGNFKISPCSSRQSRHPPRRCPRAASSSRSASSAEPSTTTINLFERNPHVTKNGPGIDPTPPRDPAHGRNAGLRGGHRPPSVREVPGSRRCPWVRRTGLGGSRDGAERGGIGAARFARVARRPSPRVALSARVAQAAPYQRGAPRPNAARGSQRIPRAHSGLARKIAVSPGM